jgi:3-hydroxyisobutyrate dehydrogenase
MKASKIKSNVGFIGLGVMGNSMAGHLLDAGYALYVYTRTPAKAANLLELGAVWKDSPADIASVCGIVFTMVGFPGDVEEVYFGENGLVGAMRPDSILVDMTTSRPDLAVRIARAAEERGGRAIDAPVSGGEKGAREATLSIMVGGERVAYERALPLLKVMGSNVVYQGPSGSGQHCKMCNQIAIAATMMGVCEAMAYARKAGLDADAVLKSISAGAAGSWSLSNLAPRMLAGDFKPGFYVKHFIKDMAIAEDSARHLKLNAPGLELALSLYRDLAALGHENEGTQVLYRLYLD